MRANSPSWAGTGLERFTLGHFSGTGSGTVGGSSYVRSSKGFSGGNVDSKLVVDLDWGYHWYQNLDIHWGGSYDVMPGANVAVVSSAAVAAFYYASRRCR